MTPPPASATTKRQALSLPFTLLASLPRTLRRGVFLGCLGSVLVTMGSVGAGSLLMRDSLLRGSGLSWLRFGHGQDMATATVYIGMALLIVAWVRMGRFVLRGRMGGAAVLLTSAMWVAPLVVAAPLFSRDVYSYLGQGQLIPRGFDPYAVGPSQVPGPLADNVSGIWQNTPAPYGPFFLLLAAGVVLAVGQNVVLGVIAMRIVLLTGMVLICWALPLLARRFGGRSATALWLVAINPVVLMHLVGGPHNDLLMVGLLLMGTALVLTRRVTAGIALVTLAAAVKATALIALPFLVWVAAAHFRSSREAGEQPAGGPNPLLVSWLKALAVSLPVFAAVFAAVSLLAGVGLGWLSALSGSSVVINWLSLPTLVAQLIRKAADIGGGSVTLGGVLRITRLIGIIALGGVLLRLWWLAREGGRRAIVMATLALLAVGLLSPATLPWYYTWPIALSAPMAWRTRGASTLAGLSVWLLLTFEPAGSTVMYSWFPLLVATAAGIGVTVALRRAPDTDRDGDLRPGTASGRGGRARPDRERAVRSSSPAHVA